MPKNLYENMHPNYLWVMYHYDSAISGVNRQIMKAYFDSFVSTGVGFFAFFLARDYIDHIFFQSKEFLVILFVSALAVFLYFGRAWSGELRHRHLRRRFHQKALEFIPKVKDHLKSNYAKKLCEDIEAGKPVIMRDIIDFVICEKTHLGIPVKNRIHYVSPPEGFIDN